MTVVIVGTSSYGWTVSQPYSDTSPLTVMPGESGQFHLVITEEDPFGAPSPVVGHLPLVYEWFTFGDNSTGGRVISLFLMPGVPLQVEVRYSIPTTALPGTYDFTYVFEHLVYSETIVGGFPVVVDGPIGNSTPIISVSSCGAYEIGIDEVWMEGFVEDADGDTVEYAWLLDDVPVANGFMPTIAGGGVVALAPAFLDLEIGWYQLALVATDGLSDPVEASCTVVVQDTTPPQLTPIAVPATLRPSNKWEPVVVMAQPAENGGGAVSLEASVLVTGFTPSARGPRFTPDAYVESIDQATGVVTLMVRPYGRRSTGFPVFVVDLNATDEAGNVATSSVSIPVLRGRTRL
jgi:hypothetical protein